jgi:hypothetical protein
MDYRQAGLSGVVEPEVVDVESGIDRVIRLIREHRLYVFDTCVGLLDELGTYSRETDEMGQPLEKIKSKQTFHRLDALRYVVAGVTEPLLPSMARAPISGLWPSREVKSVEPRTRAHRPGHAANGLYASRRRAPKDAPR